tara:strand:- start:214 stop:780 length:567 start_codon:yes stop_codon:yes gene_type:complete
VEVSKTKLRQQYRKKRTVFRKIQNDHKLLAQESVVSKLKALLAPLPEKIASYRALPEELSLEMLYADKSKSWCFPRMVGDELEFVKSPSEWKTLDFGLEEPVGPAMELAEIAAVIVPGVIFDHYGQRCGMGRGFYDRFLQETKALKIGVGFGWQVLDQPLPVDSWDIPMDFIVTEKFILDVNHFKKVS